MDDRDTICIYEGKKKKEGKKMYYNLYYESTMIKY